MTECDGSYNWSWVQPAQEWGFLGPGDTQVHIAHAIAFGKIIEDVWKGSGETAPLRYVDLGTGGGFPGLYIAQLPSVSEVLLVEARKRRAAFLSGWLGEFGLGDRARVTTDRAEDVAHGPYRGWAQCASARAFGNAAATAECGGALLAPGGVLVVSDPPGGGDEGRWPADQLRGLGLVRQPLQVDNFSFSMLRKVDVTPAMFPRRVGLPQNEPLF